MAVRVLICDDSLGFPALVGSWMRSDDRFELVGTAASGTELRELAAVTEADALVLDYVLPDVDNPAALVADLREVQPDLRILLVSSLPGAELARAAQAAGVDGHCHKVTTAAAFGDVLHAVATR